MIESAFSAFGPGSATLAAAAFMAAGAMGGALAVAMTRIFARAPPPRLITPQTDGARFRIDGSRLIFDGDTARDLAHALDLDGGAPDDIAALAACFPDGGGALLTALTALERRGIGFSVLLHDGAGVPWAALGAPDSGEAWVRIAPADASQIALRDATARADAGQDAATTAQRSLDLAPVMMWRRDLPGHLVWANARYRAFAGCEGDAQLRELEFGAGAPPRPGADTTEDTRGEGPMPDGRLALFHAVTGQRRWHEVNRTVLPDGGSLGFALDAAAAVMAESALRRFVETLPETFAHLRIGLAIFDHSRRLGLFNPAFAEMMHLDSAWLAGRPRLEDVLLRLRENRRMPDRADFAVWRAELLQLFESPDAADYAEAWQLPGDVTISVQARPHPQGSLAFLFENVSETSRLERRFATEVEIRRAVIDRLEEGVAAFGPDGAAQFANPAFARIWGFQPGAPNSPAALGTLIRRCRPLIVAPLHVAGATEPRQDIWTRLMAFAAEGARRTAWSERVRLRDGRTLRARIATLPDGSILTAFSDVTDAERATAALMERNAAVEAADEIRSALAEQSSRHVRTPLDVIGGHARALEGAGLADEQSARARAILRRAREVHDAIGGIADLADAQAGAIALNDGEVDLRAVVEAVRERLSATARERGVTLAVSVDDDVGAVPGDDARMRQILVNLITDAVQRAPGDAVVRAGVRAAAPDRAGDPQPMMVEIWTSEPTHDPEPRRGLAHALARRLAELHGGNMSIRTAPEPGHGDEERMIVICALPARRSGPSGAGLGAPTRPAPPRAAPDGLLGPLGPIAAPDTDRAPAPAGGRG